MLKLIIVIVIFLVFPGPNFPVFAQNSVVINEIMYDLDGSDTDREWIELANFGSDPVDLTNWRFEEGGTQHTLTLKQGSIQFNPNDYAVIADNTDKFLNDNPGFNGTLIDSSFSLANTGENLIIRDSQNGNIINEVNYSTDWGAADDGNSLQKKSDGSWIAATPTPGSANATEPAPSPASSQGPNTSQSSTSNSTKAKSPSPTPNNSSTSVLTKSQSPFPKSPPKVLGDQKEATVSSSDPSSPSPQLSTASADAKPQQTRIAGILIGSGVILIGASIGLYLWYRKNQQIIQADKKEENF